MDDQFAALTARIAALEARLDEQAARTAAGTTLVAPVTVRTPEGRAVAEIRAGATENVAVRLFNRAGRAVLSLGVDGTEAGYLTLRDEAGAILASLDVELAGARLQLLDHHSRAGVVVHGGDARGQGGGVLIIGPGDTGIQLWADGDGSEITVTDLEGGEAARIPAAAEPA